MALVFNMVGGGAGGPGAAIKEKDVNFYDYDGTLVASYTVADAQALSSLPLAPDHSADAVPLTFQSWNYTLLQVKAATTRLSVGATYKPIDEKTHFKLKITATTGASPTFYFTKSIASDTLTIDYGNGQVDSNSSNLSVSFTPSSPLSIANHDVKVWISSGNGTFSFGQNAPSSTLLGGSRAYQQSLVEVYIGSNVTTVGSYALYNGFFSLRKISLPTGVLGIQTHALEYCLSLRCVVVPIGATQIGQYACASCFSLERVILPASISSLESYAFYNDYAMKEALIPAGTSSAQAYCYYQCYNLSIAVMHSGVTTIGANAFYCGYSLEKIYLASTSPPNLVNINAFSGISASCLIEVPNASLSAYQSASNWSTYANYIIGGL